ncbi:MAG: magnesium transporter [Gammaproteobacteria bacterium]
MNGSSADEDEAGDSAGPDAIATAVRPGETVAEHLEAACLAVHPAERVEVVWRRLRDSARGPVELICTVDDTGRLDGAVSVSRLFAHRDGAIGSLADTRFPRVHPGDDQEHAASLALHHGVDSLPVVDAEGHLLGVMTSQALLQVLRREHVEDLHRLAGIAREEAQTRHAIEDPPLRRARHRLPWLVVGLMGSALATSVMVAFESLLSANVAVAFFVPAIVYLADAIGTQTEAIAVRRLSLTRTGIAQLLGSEARTGALIGSAIGALAFAMSYLAFGDARLAAAVGVSILVAGAIAATLGLAIPWLLASCGVDPAFGSGPVATVLQDVLSILVYFAVLQAFGA